MPSAERVAGQMRRAMNVHRFALGEKRQQENDLGALQRHKAAFKAEEIRVIAARKELYGESPHVPRFSATNLPHPVPTKLKLGWAADAEVHGWFGGCESQLEYIEAQAQKISSLQKQLETSRRATHGAIAATLRVKALNKANAAAAVTTARATTPPKQQQQQEEEEERMQTSSSQASSDCRAASAVRSASPLPRNASQTGGETGRTPNSATRQLRAGSANAARQADSRPVVGADPRDASTSELALQVSQQRRRMQQLVDSLAAERVRSNRAEEALAAERERFSVELKLIEQKLATETKRANKASADYLRMLGERDQLEWLVKRQPDGDHRGSGRSVCEVCRKSVGLATTPRDSATRQCL